jgi:hypothetical protein
VIVKKSIATVILFSLRRVKNSPKLHQIPTK